MRYLRSHTLRPAEIVEVLPRMRGGFRSAALQPFPLGAVEHVM